MAVFIPGFLIAVATFPGVILHEYSHKKACEMVGLWVYEVKYFQLGNPVGYVRHAPPWKFGQALAITMFPLLINTFAEALALLPTIFFREGFLFAFFIWLAISFGMHAIPSTKDAKSLWRYSRENWRYEKKALIGLPVAVIIYLLSLAKIVWIDLFYALGIAWAITSVLRKPFIW